MSTISTGIAPLVKICGLTEVKNAVECAEAGAHAIGLVFFEKSPRDVSVTRAKEITSNLPENVGKVGVFVNASADDIADKAYRAGLTAVQLHGNEAPDIITGLKALGIKVIKALFSGRTPELADYEYYDPDAYLVECGQGVLPGGNAKTWNWKEAACYDFGKPLILAGGLCPDNVSRAVAMAKPHAVDVSSGVELSPGFKDLKKVSQFLGNLGKNMADRDFEKKNIFL